MQSFDGYEWIVVNGGTPLQGKVADTLIEEPDDGIYDAMNKGMKEATGDYIVFLNAGDRLSDPDILSTVKRAVEHEKPDLLYGDALEEGLLYKKARHHSKINHGMITHHQSIYYRRSLIEQMSYDLSYKIAGDYAFTRQALQAAQTIHYCPAALCLFEAGGVSQRNRRIGRQEEFNIRSKEDVPLILNTMIRIRQVLTAFIKDNAPKIYQSLRRV